MTGASERDLATEVERTPHQPAQHVTAGQLDTLRHGLRGAAAALVSWTELLAEGPTAERIDRASRSAALLSRRLDELDQLVRTQREGPKVTITLSCTGCLHCESVRYRRQSDTGCDVSCSLAQRAIGDTTWTTPDWCPVSTPAEAAAAQADLQAALAAMGEP